MEENTIALLKECSSGCKMATQSIRQIREYAENEKMLQLLDAYAAKHSSFEGEIIDLLGQYGKEDEEPDKMAELWSKMDIGIKMLIKADNHQIAKLMMDGCNMGIQSLSEYVNKYSDASKESVSLAKRMIKAEEDFMAEMKQFM